MNIKEKKFLLSLLKDGDAVFDQDFQLDPEILEAQKECQNLIEQVKSAKNDPELAFCLDRAVSNESVLTAQLAYTKGMQLGAKIITALLSDYGTT